ncbi:SNARE Sec20 [Schizosaccharomyces japonicus yFS275]|uniref:SNARE Sec20 n=1 Tax=Schizosaccharomyces japonicus (strain yFS275 / FY16936) TaxID=402676 RepID=B6K1U2_SCHJY|nr:SNARE Sec20 [Schizosaccharomyces japonicus yFS275]EEB07123.1 SNARE Sec20 [Schizosaccharomyces japonicus yFS275]
MEQQLEALEQKSRALLLATSVDELKQLFREFRSNWEMLQVMLLHADATVEQIVRYEKAVQEFQRLNSRYRRQILETRSWNPFIKPVAKETIDDNTNDAENDQKNISNQLFPQNTATLPDGMLVSSATQVTSAMRGIHSQLVQAIDLSVNSSQQLEESTSVLQDLQEKYFSLGDVIFSSRRLIKELKMSDKGDYLLVMSGFYILMAIVLFILWKRVLWPFLSIFLFFW